MALPLPARAPDPSALAAYWAEYEDLCRQISAANEDDDNLYEGRFLFLLRTATSSIMRRFYYVRNEEVLFVSRYEALS